MIIKQKRLTAAHEAATFRATWMQLGALLSSNDTRQVKTAADAREVLELHTTFCGGGKGWDYERIKRAGRLETDEVDSIAEFRLTRHQAEKAISAIEACFGGEGGLTGLGARHLAELEAELQDFTAPPPEAEVAPVEAAPN